MSPSTLRGHGEAAAYTKCTIPSLVLWEADNLYMVLGGRTEVAARLEHVLDCWVHMLLVVITVDIEGEVEALPVKQWCWSFAFRLCAKCQYQTGPTKSARQKSEPREQITSTGAELRRN